MEALPTLGIVLVLVFGTYRIGAGAITRGELVQVAALFTVLALPMRVMGFFLEMVPPSVVARRRLDLVLDEELPAPPQSPQTLPPGPLATTARRLLVDVRRASPMSSVPVVGGRWCEEAEITTSRSRSR